MSIYIESVILFCFLLFNPILISMTMTVVLLLIFVQNIIYTKET